MNFFDFQPDATASGGYILVGHDLWVYFVVSAPLTLLLFTIWWKLQAQIESEARGQTVDEVVPKDPEQGVARRNS